MGDTEYFELCEISSQIQCPDCFENWDVGIVHCTCGKCMQPSERNRQLNKERYYVQSIPGYVMKKESFPWSQTWTNNAAENVLQSTRNAEESPQAQKWWLLEHSGQMAFCGKLGGGNRGNHHPGLNNDFSFIVPVSLAGNLISWQSTGCVNSTRTAHTFSHAQSLHSHLVTDFTH